MIDFSLDPDLYSSEKYECKRITYAHAITKDVVIWGRGEAAILAYADFDSAGVNVLGFTDSFADKGEYCGKRLFQKDELTGLGEIAIFIASYNEKFRLEIMSELAKYSNITAFCRGDIWKPARYKIDKINERVIKDYSEIEYVRRNLADEESRGIFDILLKYRQTNDYNVLLGINKYTINEQYFEPFINFDSEGVFIDAGGYMGETSIRYSEVTGGRYDEIYIFEPDKVLYEITKERINIRNMHSVNVIQKGLYSETSNVYFESNADIGASAIKKNGEDLIETISLDEMNIKKKVSFIKMDIEGAEREALHGARNTICEYLPKLAICVYHKADDLWKIPYNIMKMDIYKNFYIRHYSRCNLDESVFYATN